MTTALGVYLSPSLVGILWTSGMLVHTMGDCCVFYFHVHENALK